jgi:hypothetical protein
MTAQMIMQIVFYGHVHGVLQSRDDHLVWTCVNENRGGVYEPVCLADMCVSFSRSGKNTGPLSVSIFSTPTRDHKNMKIHWADYRQRSSLQPNS